MGKDFFVPICLYYKLLNIQDSLDGHAVALPILPLKNLTHLFHAPYVWLCLSLLIPSISTAAEPSKARQAELQNMLKHDCGSCHGLTLKGGLGPSLLAKDLTNKPGEYLLDTIQNGRKGTAMPPWSLFISEQETRWLIQTLLKSSSGF